METTNSMRCEREALCQVSTIPSFRPINPEEWGDPEDLCLPPFPVELLPSTWSDFVVQVADAAHAPVDFAVAAFLRTVSAALTGRIFVHISDIFDVPVQFYLGLIGFSRSGKSPVMKIMSKPLKNWLFHQRRKVKDDNVVNTMDGRPLRPEPESLISDITPEALL